MVKVFTGGQSLLPDMKTVVKAFAPGFILAVTPLGLCTGKAVKIFKEEAGKTETPPERSGQIRPRESVLG